jgi:hypothetical protein
MSTAETSDYGYPTGRLNTISNPSTTTDQVHPLPKADSVAVTWGTEPRNRSRQTGHCRSREDRLATLNPGTPSTPHPRSCSVAVASGKLGDSHVSGGDARRSLLTTSAGLSDPAPTQPEGRAFRTIGGHHDHPPHLRSRYRGRHPRVPG